MTGSDERIPFDSFWGEIPCPNCGEPVARRLRLDMVGVSGREYETGEALDAKFLRLVVLAERQTREILGLAGHPPETAAGSFVISGIGESTGACSSCGEVPPEGGCCAVVKKGIFTRLTRSAPCGFAILLDQGIVLPEAGRGHDRGPRVIFDAWSRPPGFEEE